MLASMRILGLRTCSLLIAFLTSSLLLGCGNDIRVEQTPPAPPDDVVPVLPTGACPPDAPATIATLNTPHGLSASSDRLFFTDRGDLYSCDGSVQSVPLSGGMPEVHVANLCAPNRLEYHNDVVYWLSHSGYVAPNGDVTALDLATGDVLIVATGLISPDGLAVDSRYVYVGADVEVMLQSPGRLLRIDRQTNEMVELATSEGQVVEIAVDDEYVYWVSLVGYLNGKPNNDTAIYRISKQGGVKETLLADLPHGYGLARVGTRLWLAESDGDQIIEMSADGSDLKVVATMVSSPNDIASDGENIYVTSWNKPGDLLEVEKGIGKSIATSIGYGDQILLGENCIYWTEQYIDDDFNGVVRAMAR
jgi:hypothetical protein